MTWIVRTDRAFEVDGNPFYKYRETELDTPGGPARYFGALIRPCVHVVGIEEDETTYLVRQRRPNVRQLGDPHVPGTLELPGGLTKPGKSLEASARDEFTEETQRQAATMQHVGMLWPSTGISSEEDNIFLATGLTAAEGVTGSGEATEHDLQVVTMKFGDALRMFQTSEEPVSAQTLAALFKVAAFL